jgi:hypothetical protein
LKIENKFDFSTIADLYYYKAMIYYDKNDITKCKKYLNKSIFIYKKRDVANILHYSNAVNLLKEIENNN